jgi:hypothetical protein
MRSSLCLTGVYQNAWPRHCVPVSGSWLVFLLAKTLRSTNSADFNFHCPLCSLASSLIWFCLTSWRCRCWDYSSVPQPNRPGTVADYLQDFPSSAQKTSAHAPGLWLRRASLIPRHYAIRPCCLPYQSTRSALSILFSELNTEPMLSPVNA